MPREHSGELSAMGHEKIIHIDPNNPDRIHAVFRNKESGYQPTVFQTRGRFYLSKILYLLFPEMIPEVHAIGTGNGGFLDTQKFETDEEHKLMQVVRTRMERGEEIPAAEREKAYRLTQERERDPRIQKFVDTLRNLGVPVDPTGDNYSFDRKGGVQYLDNSFRPWQINRFGKKMIVKAYDADKLSAAIDQLPSASQEQAEKYLGRLEELFHEEETNLRVHPEAYPLITENKRVVDS